MNKTIASETKSEPLFFEVFPSRVNILRTDELDDVSKQLENSGRFVALRGDGGGGKSYFLRHQLIPFYEQQVTNDDQELAGEWRIASFSPQVNPIGTLALALSTPGVLREQKDITPFFREELEAQLRQGSKSLIDIYHDAEEKGSKAFRLLLVIDQLEDMFHMADELHRKRSKEYEGLGDYYQPGDDILFFELFRNILDAELPIHVLFSIGSDSIDRLNAYEGWPERISMHSYALPLIEVSQIEAALKSNLPEGRQEFNEAEKKLIDPLLTDYRELSGNKEEPVARVNIALDLLYRCTSEKLVEAFTTLNAPVDFLTRILSTDIESAQQISAIRGAFKEVKNRKAWDIWIADEATPEELDRLKEVEAEYFNGLETEYYKFGGLQGAPNYFYDHAYSQLAKSHQRYAARLIKAVTVKDVMPNVVADSYSVPFSVLVDLVFRKGEEYPEIMTILQEDQQPVNTLVEGGSAAEKQQIVDGIIRRFNFVGGTIPDLVRWIIPAGHIGDSEGVKFGEGTIIKLGTSTLVQEWSKLCEWVDEEYEAAMIYRRLVEDGIGYYEKNPPQEKGGASPDKPAVPSITDTLRETGVTFWGQLKEMIAGLGLNFWAKTDAGQEHKEPESQNAHELSEGRTEQIKIWFRDNLPSTNWAKKYRTQEIISTEKDTLAHGAAPAQTEFKKWVEGGNIKAFFLARKYWLEQYHFYKKVKADKEAAILARINKQKRISKVMTGLTGLAIILTGFATWAYLDAKETRNNLRLLDFVDNMTKAHLIPSSIYRSDGFKELKENVEDNEDISNKGIVIDTLAKWGILNFQNKTTSSRHGQVSKAALLQLDSLIDNYHGRDTRGMVSITKSILRTADTAIQINEATQTLNYQYPYVYQVLYENFDALKTIVRPKGRLAMQGQFSGKELGGIDTLFAPISAVVSNPTVVDQYAVGDEMGNVKIFTKGNKEFGRVPSLPNGISSLQYSFSGRELYATDYTGNIFRFWPLASSNNQQSPRGLTGALNLARLRVVEWEKSNLSLPIISIHNTLSEKYLMVRKDVGIYLIKKLDDTTYSEVDYMPLVEDLSSLNTMAGNHDGTLFMVGGAGASALVSVDVVSAKIKLERTIEHKNISVSAIAFQPPAAPGVRAQRVAVGTSAGDLWLTDVQSFAATGMRQDMLLRKLERKANKVSKENYQESAITGLAFNDTGDDRVGNEQLIASSLDGTVYLFNFDVITDDKDEFLERTAASGIWDHLQLTSSGRSVDNVCLVNKNKIVVVENNLLRAWPTNLQTLRGKVDSLLFIYEQMLK